MKKPKCRFKTGNLAMPPKVSVIMPVYNGADFTNRSINGILSQTFKSFELIIINDGSTDNTKTTVKKYRDKRIVYLENKKNLGVSNARNRGLRIARGEYIAYCDHDDIYYPQHLERFVHILNSRPDIGLVYANYIDIRPGLEAKTMPHSEFQKEKELSTFIGPPVNVIHRAISAAKPDVFDRSRVLTKYCGEDTEFWLKLSDRFKFFHINEVLSEHIVREKSRSTTADCFKPFKYIVKKRWRKQNTKKKRIDYIANHAIYIIRAFLKNGAVDEASKLAEKFYAIQKGYHTSACLGFCSFAKSDFRGAISQFNKALKLAPKTRLRKDDASIDDLIAIKLDLAIAYFQTGEFDKAAGLCRQMLPLAERAARSRHLLARIYIKNARYAAALGLLKTVDDAHSRCLRGSCYFYMKKWGRAVEEFKVALKKDPRLFMAYYDLSLAYAKIGDHEMAIQTLKTARRINPRHAQTEKMLLRLALERRGPLDMPLVSVILPTYNRAHTVKRAVQSVLRQTFKNFELIIVNDGSADNTRETVLNYDDERILYIEKNNGGPASARNAGIRYSVGKYTAYLDDDDIYCPDHLKKLVAFLESHPDIGMVYTDALDVDAHGGFGKKHEVNFNKRLLEFKCYIPTSTVLHRCQCADIAGFFDERLLMAQDWDMWLRISDSFKIARVPGVSVKRFCRKEKDSVAYRRRASRFAIRVVRKRIEKVKADGTLIEYINDHSIGVIEMLLARRRFDYAGSLAKSFIGTVKNYRTLACMGLCKFKAGDFDTAGKYLVNSLRLMPLYTDFPDLMVRDDFLLIKSRLASIYFHLGKVGLASDLCREVLSVNQNYAEAKQILARCLLRNGETAKALKLLFRMSDSYSHAMRGACYFALKKYISSIDELGHGANRLPTAKINRRDTETAKLSI